MPLAGLLFVVSRPFVNAGLLQGEKMNGSKRLLHTETELMHVEFPYDYHSCLFPLLHTPACHISVSTRKVLARAEALGIALEIDLI